MNQTKTEKATILCMFSGGIDSTGVLHQLLTNEKFEEHPIILHHIHIHNRENRARAELQAVKEILAYYKTNVQKEFVVTESVFNTMGFAGLKAKRFPYDMDVCAFYGANLAVAKKEIRHVAWGRTKTDVNSGGNFEARMKRMQDVFNSVWVLEKEQPPSFIFPIIDYDKKQIWFSLPEPVRKMVWWCRTPVYEGNIARPCGSCGTCLQVKEFINGKE
ncbi:7-cyano-7-deazaguanine synthase [Ekhidna sp. MALMAid0563]|uniref:7-cyano-7-deazaguanine synthase n=1 Tax=Ekhidna sp. MALMAid0563 TaxID=3143937 RepID=UPI0032DF8E6D